MASAQVVQTSVTNNSPSQDSSHPDDLFESKCSTTLDQGMSRNAPPKALRDILKDGCEVGVRSIGNSFSKSFWFSLEHKILERIFLRILLITCTHSQDFSSEPFLDGCCNVVFNRNAERSESYVHADFRSESRSETENISLSFSLLSRVNALFKAMETLFLTNIIHTPNRIQESQCSEHISSKFAQ